MTRSAVRSMDGTAQRRGRRFTGSDEGTALAGALARDAAPQDLAAALYGRFQPAIDPDACEPPAPARRGLDRRAA